MRHISQDIRVCHPVNATAAGTTAINGTGIDMSLDGGYDGCLFILGLGTLTATQVTQIKAQQSDDDAATDAYDDLASSKCAAANDADGNKVQILDIYQPGKRWLRPVVLRGTANAVVDFVIAILYRGHKRPSTHLAIGAAPVVRLVAPAEGTA